MIIFLSVNYSFIISNIINYPSINKALTINVPLTNKVISIDGPSTYTLLPINLDSLLNNAMVYWPTRTYLYRSTVNVHVMKIDGPSTNKQLFINGPSTTKQIYVTGSLLY